MRVHDPLEHAERDYARYKQLDASGSVTSVEECVAANGDLTTTTAWQLGLMTAHVANLMDEVRRLRAAQAVAA